MVFVLFLWRKKITVMATIAKPKTTTSIIIKPIHLWTESEKLERKKFLKKNVYFKKGDYRELVDDPFNLKR